MLDQEFSASCLLDLLLQLPKRQHPASIHEAAQLINSVGLPVRARVLLPRALEVGLAVFRTGWSCRDVRHGTSTSVAMCVFFARLPKTFGNQTMLAR
jgi:hypothetical protein